jgi:23S rRNA pseudouridine1911/1915/1917 synthase
MKTLDFKVQDLPEDARLDKVIPHLDKEISRSMARKLIENGSVYLNGKRCKMNAKPVAMGDKIRLVIDESKEEKEEFLFTADRVVFEDADIIVVNKPPYLPTHETIDTTRHHLVVALQKFLGERDKKKPAMVYLGIHHRLDVNTSGLILFTKRKEANAPVAQAFQERLVQKTYLALSRGKLDEPKVLKSFIGPSARNKRVFASIKKNGKYAETEIRSVERRGDLTLVEAKPKTGRTHQIRVHLSENGLPIIGDQTYGVSHPKAERVMLHAWRLEILGKNFRAALPEDFRRLAFEEPRD